MSNWFPVREPISVLFRSAFAVQYNVQLEAGFLGIGPFRLMLNQQATCYQCDSVIQILRICSYIWRKRCRGIRKHNSWLTSTV